MAYSGMQGGGSQSDLAEQSLRRGERWLSGEEDAFQAAMNGEPLKKSLKILIQAALEEVDNDRRCAFYIANATRTELRHVVGMPESYARQVDGFKIGLDSLACGLAAATGEPVITPDVAEEPRWEPWLWLARDYDFRGVWSFPVETSAGKIVGTFAMYFHEPREPTSRDFRLIASLTHSASIIISHHQQAEERATAEAALAAQHILKESEERFRNLANCAPVMLWMTGPDKLCRFANQGWLEFSGRTIDQEVGDGWAETLHPADREHYINTWCAAFDARQPFKTEVRFKRCDGEYRWFENAAMPRFAPDGEFLGYVGSSIDITDRKKAQEIEGNLVDLQRLATIGELTAAIAHEIRQPLAAIKLNAQAGQKLLRTAPESSASLHDIYSDILADDERAEDILTRIRDFTLKRAAERTLLNITSVIEETVRLVAADAQKRRIRIDTKLKPSIPPVMGDRTQLHQVLMNLIVNAMDAMQSTPTSLRHITVEARRVGDDVSVAVVDQGHGIEQSQLPRVFESFFTTKSDGMGLGLSIAKSIVERHGGHIWAEGNAARGTTFRFTLPMPSQPTSIRSHD
jgi:PAS domain S-box-containing protein